MTPDIYLLGSGIHGALQFTRETEQALRSCRATYVLHDDLMVHEHVRELCAETHDLAPLYSGKTLRRDVYKAMSELLIEAATRGGPVALVAHGHPLFLVSATEYTLARAAERGLSVHMLPAVSSFDTILCDLGIDYGYGVQLFDATTLIRSDWLPNPKVPMLVFQLATTLVDEVVEGMPATAALAPLVDHLRRAYPANHECTVVHSSAHLLERGTLVSTTIGRLHETAEIELWKRPTLYVPAVA